MSAYVRNARKDKDTKERAAENLPTPHKLSVSDVATTQQSVQERCSRGARAARVAQASSVRMYVCMQMYANV